MPAKLLVLAFTISIALALNCYKCTSNNHHLCGSSNITNGSLPSVNCNEGPVGLMPFQCIKIVTRGKDDSEDVTRACAPNVNTTCDSVIGVLRKVTKGPEIEKIDCFTCPDDNCNV